MSNGNGHSAILTFTAAPERVVSLVPSMTDSLFELGAGARLVGITDYCRPPASEGGRLVRVGGTKSADLNSIVELAPDLVMANQEENERPLVEALEAKGLKVWVTFPRSVDEAIRVLWALVELFRIPHAGVRVKTLEVTLEWERQAAANRALVSVFCPIWEEEAPETGLWWMTFDRHTYAHDVLARCGGENIFGGRARRYPLAADLGKASPEDPGPRDTRYPRVTPEEVIAAAPEVILIPDEPMPFGPEQEARIRSLLAETPAVRAGRVHRVDGRLIAWHGTYLARALAELPALLVPVAG